MQLAVSRQAMALSHFSAPYLPTEQSLRSGQSLVRVDRVLLEAGVAKPADLLKVMQVLPKPIFVDGLGVPLPLHAKMSNAASV
ncbi:unnamed protein product [Toxocara canis]|uniref:Hemin ABC transporter substrate-binding protein n=1 Tax=Toxocara canis TaxID=6265 RepID=A0A183U172_TOXCA|nr:unnamed protein product [Toxocara canis]